MIFRIESRPVWSWLRRQYHWVASKKRLAALLSIGALLPLFTPASAQNSNLTWQRLSGAAIDLAIGHQGQMWAVGADKLAYRWNASRKTWVRYGQRNDFTRIDGEAGGGAIAVTSSGRIYYTDGKATGKTKWLEIGGGVYDIGIGGGWIWITSTNKASGGRQVFRGRDQGGGDFDFQRVPGGMVHIDVDPKGNAWGVNDQNNVFQFVGGKWRRHSGKKATDIGVGGDGTVWIVGTDFVASKGGATLHRRDPRTRKWITDTRRLRTITVGPGGQPAGVSSTNEIWDKSARAPNPREPETEPETEPGPDGEVVEKPKPQPEMRGRVVSKHSGDWYQFPGLAQDMGRGARGHIWVVGTDRFAYRWDRGKKSWIRIGKRQDFVHIDAASDGGALAVTTDGAVYFAGRNAGQGTRWTKVGDNARDIGIGGGWAWITRRAGGGGQVWRASYDGSGRFRWRRIPGNVPVGLAHIDGDPNGNAWGVSDTNQIYRFDGEKWKKQPSEATDIGIGADNTVWIVGTDIVDRLGGGWLYQFDARARKWIKGVRRLRTVTAGQRGNPAGTEHDHEIWVRNYGDAGKSDRTNLALRKVTSQSPQRRGRGLAARAVDGNTDGKFKNGSVTDIRSGDGPAWLMVDLGAVYRIDSIRIHNRTDCCSSRLNRAVVETSNNGEWEAADTTFSGTIKKARPYADVTVGKTGRYVRVRQTSKQILGIAEVEVFGRSTPVTAVSSINIKTDIKKSAIRYPQGWKQLAGLALDMGLSGKGHMWVIGADKFAYRWDAATKKWLRHGKRQDFARIDAADDGSALAVSGSGGLYYSSGKDSKKAKWQRVAGKTRDVGIGGGWAWIVSTGNAKGGGVIARARYGKAGKFRWQRVAGRLVRIDGGPKGEAWGVDGKGDVYRRTRGKWRKQAGRQATDIGVGSKGTVWVVEKDVDKAAGGGRLYRRDAVTKAWATDNARLQTVTVGQDGQPAGVNAANEMWARGDTSGAGPLDVAGGPKDPNEGKSAQVLALEGMRAALPQSLKAIALEGTKTEKGFTSGSVALNGNPAVIVIYTPEGKTKSNVVIWHKRFKFSDYMPDAGGTPLDNVGTLTGTSFWIVPAGNENTRLPAEVIAHLNGLSAGEGKPFPHNLSLKAGVNLVATFESAQMPGVTHVAKLFGRRPKDFYLRGTVDKSIFKKVKQTTVKPTPSSDPKAMAKLIAVYGDVFLKNLVLEGEKLPEFKTGPLTYTDAKYEVSGEAGAIQVGFEVSLEMDVAPQDDSGEPAATVQFDAIRVDYDQGEKTVTLTGDIDASAADKLISYRGLTIETLSFEGVKPEDAPLSVTLDGTGKLKSKAIKFEIVLEQRNDKYEATLKLKGEWTLAEILDHVFQRGAPPGSDKIVLEDVETSTSGDYLAGTASLAGEDVRFSVFKPENQNVMVVIEHRALELANYLPQLADTPVKKIGLGRSIFIVVGDLKNPNGSDLIGPTLEVTNENKGTLLPSYIVKQLELLESEATGTIAGKGIYPLTLRANGTTIFALYTTGKDQVSTADEDQQKVIDSLGIEDDTYILKGFVNKDMIRAARYAKKKLGSGSGAGSTIRELVLPLLDGLDIGFPIPGFKPPKTGDWITFSESRFRLKGIDGKLETFVSSGMAVRLPGSAKTGVKAMNMVGKVKPVVLKKNLEVEFAATTQLTGTEADETPFARLKALNDPDAEEAVSALVPTTEPSQGWKPAFGVPFLTVEQMSVGGSFTDGGTTGDVKVNVGLQSVVEDRSPGQRLVLKGELLVTRNEITDMVLEIPGSVKVGALPGINDIPGVNALTFSDVKLSRYELAGQVEGRGATLEGVLSRNPEDEDYALYLAAKDINLGTFSQKFSRKLPSTFGDFPIQSGVMVGSNMPTQQGIVVADLRDRAQALFEGIVEDDAEITIAKGVSVFTKLEPEKLPESNKFRKLFVKEFGFKEPLLFEGAIEDSGGSATPKVRLAASIPNYKIPGVSDKILEFTGTRMVLEDIGGALTGSVEGGMMFKVKGQEFELEDGKVSVAVEGKDRELQVTGASTKEWKKAFGIPFLTLNRLELDANVKTSDAGPDVDWGIKTKSVLNKASPDEQTFDANGQLLVQENVVTDIVLELPGEVWLNKLPGIREIPGLNQLTYKDVKLSLYEIAAKVRWPKNSTHVDGVFLRDRDSGEKVEYTLYAATENAKLSHLSGKIPSTLAEFPIQKGVVVFSNQPEETLKISELPERVQPLFTGYFAQDKELSIVQGISVYTTLDPNKPQKGDPFWDLLFGKSSFALEDPVTFEGSIIRNEPDPSKVRLAAAIPTYKMPFIPEDILKFDNSEIVFSNEGGKTAAIKGEMTFKALKQTRKLDGSVTFAGSEGNKELKVEGRSRERWEKAFGIPGLALSNIGLQVEKKRGDTSSTGLGIKADAHFGGQDPQTEGQLVIADGKLAGASFTLLGTVSMSTLPGIKEIPILDEFTFTDVVLSKNLIADSNLVAAKTAWERIGKDKKLDTAFIEKDGTFAVLMKADSFSIGQLSSGVPSPISGITIPNSVVAVSNQEFDSFDVAELPESVRKTLFDDIVGESTNQRIKITEGVTVLTKLDPKALPGPISTPMDKVFQIKEPVIAAGTIGGVFGGAAGAALYAQIPNAVIPGGDVLKKMLNFRDVTFFMRANAGSVSQVGFGGAMDFNMPRLDDPNKSDTLDLAGELYVDVSPGAPPGVEIAGKMTGRWDNPMGLNDFTFEDTEIKVGVNPGSVDVGIGGQAEFNSKTDGLVYYAMDLLVGIVPGTIVPNKLAVQFVGKLKRGDQLVDGASIGPVTMVEMADSLFRGVLAGGASDGFLTQVQPAAARDAGKKLQGLIKNQSLLKIMPIDKVPLPLLSVRDPLIYFSTPGAGLPPRPGIPAPTLGLGVLVNGTLDFTMLKKSTTLADADIGLTLSKGLWITAKFPKRQFGPMSAVSYLDVQAGLNDLGSGSFALHGSAGLDGSIPLLGANASYSLNVTQSGGVANPTTEMNGTANVSGIKRDIGLKVTPTSTDFWSPGTCTSPIDVSWKASYKDFKGFFDSFDLSNLKPQGTEAAPEKLLKCNPQDVLKMVAAAAMPVGDFTVKVASKTGGLAIDASKASIENAQKAVNAAEKAIGVKAPLPPVPDILPGPADIAKAEGAVHLAADKVKEAGKAVNDAFLEVNDKLNVFNNAAAAFDSAVQILTDLGCAIGEVATLGAASCDDDDYDRAINAQNARNEAAARATKALEAKNEAEEAKKKAEAARNEAAKKVQDLKDKIVRNRNDLRNNMERIRRNEVNRLRAQRQLSGAKEQAVRQFVNAATCPPAQHWDANFNQCWLDDDGFARFSTNEWLGKSQTGRARIPPRCMAVDGSGKLYKDVCSMRPRLAYGIWQVARDTRFKFTQDKTIQTATGKCLGIAENAGKLSKNPQVFAMTCSGAKTQKWQYKNNGRISMRLSGLVNFQGKPVEELCLTDLPAETFHVADDEALYLADCDLDKIDWSNHPNKIKRGKPFDWIPVFGTGHKRKERELADTIMLKLGDLCLDGGAGYKAPPSFWTCDEKNKNQFFAPDFVDDDHFLLSSRTAHTCLDASDVIEKKASQIVGAPCYRNQTQQFSLTKGVGGRVQFKNRETETCLSLDAKQSGGGAGLTLAACGSGQSLKFQILDVDGAAKLPEPPRPHLREEDLRIELKLKYVERTFMFTAASGGAIGYDRVPGGPKANVIATGPTSLANFQVLLGLHEDKRAVSLQAVSGLAFNDQALCPISDIPDKQYFLHASGTQLDVRANQYGTEFTRAASFNIVEGLNGDPDSISFESLAMPGHYIFKNGSSFGLGTGSDSAFQKNASFTAEDRTRSIGLKGPTCVKRPDLRG